MTIDVLPRLLNRHHGARSTRQEALLHARHVIEKFKISIKDAAAMFAIKEGILKEELTQWQTIQRLAKMAIDATKLPKSSIRKFNTLKNDNVLKAAAVLALNHKLQVSDVEAMIDGVKEERTEATQIAYVEKLQRELDAKSPKPIIKNTRNERTKVLIALKSLENFANEPGATLSRWQITDESERAAIRKRIDTLISSLRQILRESVGKKEDRKNAG